MNVDFEAVQRLYAEAVTKGDDLLSLACSAVMNGRGTRAAKDYVSAALALRAAERAVLH